MHFPHIGHHCYHVDICLMWIFKKFIYFVLEYSQLAKCDSFS